MGNAGLDEAQTEIEIAGRNINNLTHADDTKIMKSPTVSIVPLSIFREVMGLDAMLLDF